LGEEPGQFGTMSDVSEVVSIITPTPDNGDRDSVRNVGYKHHIDTIPEKDMLNLNEVMEEEREKCYVQRRMEENGITKQRIVTK
jgi:hypothetical protein